MKNFDVRIISKDIIDGEPLATCLVTHNGLFFAVVRYNYFTYHYTNVSIIDCGTVYKLFNIHYLTEYNALISEMYEAVTETIRKNII